ncbi:SRPBCC family protein [Streptomyces sp. NPDC001820]|uniref:SRPBCC family protein n=1 Tax=Streptomyces sp. NPDC001820 TaxID=3364613 RepID=UPI00368AF230
MARTFSVSDSIVIDAAPPTIYAQVSNPSLMGHWSPENRGATVLDGAEKAYVGMVFDGYNKRGPMRWTTRCTVTAADPGERFAFRVRAIGRRRPVLSARIASWEYRFEAVDGGTRVTETWTDDRRAWPDALAHAFDRVATRGHTFADFQRRNIRITLDNLKRTMEAAQAKD